MIRHHSFEPEPWGIREKGLDLDVLAQTESLLALSNGHIGLRANLDEGDVWPTAFALKELTAAEEARIGALVKKAVS